MLDSRSFAWTADSQLASLTASTGNESYAYSAFGTRAKVGNRAFLRAGAGVKASVLDDGNASYTPGVSEVRGSMTTYSHSGLKNAGVQSDSPGSGSPAIQATRAFDAFGATQSSSGTWNGPFGYAGAFGYQSPQTGNEQGGLHLLGHRYYDATLGRFLTRDPIGDGSNWYAYCANDPVGLADPYGLRASAFGCPAGDFLAGFADRLTETPLPGAPFSPQPKPLLTTKNIRTWFGQDHLVELDSGHYGGGGVAADIWFMLLTGKVSLPKVTRLKWFDDAANGAKAIIGENMRRRVLPRAQQMPWLDTFSPTTRSRIGGFGQNMRWVLKHCIQGHDFVDIGIDVARSSRSWWYRAERAVIWVFE